MGLSDINSLARLMCRWEQKSWVCLSTLLISFFMYG